LIVIESGVWRIEWGQGSFRPDNYMLYHEGGEYVGTFLTLATALRQARHYVSVEKFQRFNNVEYAK
jgi:hypothetical protein